MANPGSNSASCLAQFILLVNFVADSKAFSKAGASEFSKESCNRLVWAASKCEVVEVFLEEPDDRFPFLQIVSSRLSEELNTKSFYLKNRRNCSLQHRWDLGLFEK